MKGRMTWVDNAELRTSHRETLETHAREEDGDICDVCRDSLAVLDFAEIAVAERDAALAENAALWRVAELARIHVKKGGMANAQRLADALNTYEALRGPRLNEALDTKPEGER